MKVKWVELIEDDPIFNQGFIILSPNKKRPKKKNEAKKQNNEKKDKIKSQNKKKGD